MRGIYEGSIARPDGTELVYVGQSANIEKRQYEHLRELRQGTHHGRLRSRPNFFQRAFNKYGEAALSWRVLEVLEGATDAELDAAEQRWIDRRKGELGRDNVMNVSNVAANPMKDPELVRRITSTPNGGPPEFVEAKREPPVRSGGRFRPRLALAGRTTQPGEQQL